jgi:hypothetical protein
MLLACLVIGGLAAYYLGTRAGVVAAGAAFALFIAADVIPALSFWLYAVVAAGVLALCTLGPRFQKQDHRDRMLALGREGAKRLFKLIRR